MFRITVRFSGKRNYSFPFHLSITAALNRVRCKRLLDGTVIEDTKRSWTKWQRKWTNSAEKEIRRRCFSKCANFLAKSGISPTICIEWNLFRPLRSSAIKLKKRPFLPLRDEFPREGINSLRQRKLLRRFSLRPKRAFLPLSGEIVHLRSHFIQDPGRVFGAFKTCWLLRLRWQYGQAASAIDKDQKYRWTARTVPKYEAMDKRVCRLPS